MNTTHLRNDNLWEEDALAAMRHSEGWRGVNSAIYGVPTKSQENAVGTKFSNQAWGIFIL